MIPTNKLKSEAADASRESQMSAALQSLTNCAVCLASAAEAFMRLSSATPEVRRIIRDANLRAVERLSKLEDSNDATKVTLAFGQIDDVLSVAKRIAATAGGDAAT